MEFAYLDESGDIGAKGSNKILMCLVCTKRRKKLNRIIRKTKQRLLRKKKTADWLNRKGEVKFYSFPDKNLLIKTLKEIAKVDFKAYYVCFNKKNENFNPISKRIIMADLFIHIFEACNKEKPINVTSDLDFFSKKPSYFSLVEYQKKRAILIDKDGKEQKGWKENIGFTDINKEEYDKNKTKKNLFLIKINPKNSRLNNELQAVDLICGSIFQFVENSNSIYYDIIKKRVVRGTEFK